MEEAWERPLAPSTLRGLSEKGQSMNQVMGLQPTLDLQPTPGLP
jgi:hypothetical protein